MECLACNVGEEETQGLCVLFGTKQHSAVSEYLSCMDGSEGIAVFFAATR